MSEPPATLHAFCRRILVSGDLETKLAPPAALDDSRPGPPLRVERPAREPALSLGGGAEKLPSLASLSDSAARARCLARFAHHELMAVELFAWALLRWPDLPSGLRAALRSVLADEQRHCRLYLARLEAHGSSLADHPRSDYFWRQASALGASPHGPRAFLAGMGLTLEQANLDFSALYAEGFRRGGDPESAAVCEEVHEDEVRHVRIAATWLVRLAEGPASDLEAYLDAVPFPLGLTRARGRRFDATARRRARLSEPFIEAVRRARSRDGAPRASGGDPEGLRLHANIGAEEPGAPDTAPARSAARLWRMLFPAPPDAADSWPEAFATSRSEPAFAWLPRSGLCAWWNDAGAREEEREDLPLWGASPDAVARVHDKAFATRVAEEAGWTPGPLRGRIVPFEAGELRSPAAAAERVRRELASWPASLARRFTLKPRLGTSGRGRVDVRGREAPDLAERLGPLAERGGALLEPWLARVDDYSVQLYVAPDGAITLLGVLAQRTSRAGLYRGHAGELDHRGRVVSGGPHDDELIAAALELARAAHAEGFHGPCGVDAFAFTWERRRLLRPVVELNARFTMGTVVLGLLRRARPWIADALAPAPGERLPFEFAFRGAASPPAPGVARLVLPDGVLSVARHAPRAGGAQRLS